MNPLVKALVLFHLAAIALWSLPNPPSNPVGTARLLEYTKQFKYNTFPIRWYVLPTGVWQYWDMFSPNPSSWDGWVDAEVEFPGGSKIIYAYPRVHDMPIVLKYFKERYRKFLERAHTEQSQWLWPTFAQRIALEVYEKYRKMPSVVSLRRHWRIVQPPDKPQPKNYQMFVYYRHIVDQRKVRELAAM